MARTEGPRWGIVLLAAGAAGVALGVAARAWMRLIAPEPSLTAAGTLFIVLAFGVLGVSQAVAALGRRPGVSRRGRRASRAVGVAGILPLFVAAGATMAPVVVLGGLAAARADWSRRARAVLIAGALADAALVAAGIAGDVGGGRAVLGIAGLVALYAVVVLTARPTFAPPPGESRRMEPMTRLALAGALAGAVAVIALLASMT